QLTNRGILHHLLDMELCRTNANALRHPAGDDRNVQSRLTHEIHAKAVLDVVALELEISSTTCTEIHAAVGQDAVNIEHHEANAAREFGRDHVRTASHTARARSANSPSWASGIMFGPSLGERSGSGWVSRKMPF